LLDLAIILTGLFVDIMTGITPDAFPAALSMVKVKAARAGRVGDAFCDLARAGSRGVGGADDAIRYLDELSRTSKTRPVLQSGDEVINLADEATKLKATGRWGDELLDAAAPKTTAVQKYWPENNGFLRQPEAVTLKPGQRIDRFGGSDYSRFFSPEGTPAAARALPAESASQPLRTFEVVKPFEVEAGTVAPAFGQPGLGTQFRTPVQLKTLLERGIIKEVTP
jgi:hypothetical protein